MTMTLAAYLSDNKITYTAFAEKIGVKNARTVERYAKGQRMPDATVMPRIVQETGGQVTPNDFYSLTAVV